MMDSLSTMERCYLKFHTSVRMKLDVMNRISPEISFEIAFEFSYGRNVYDISYEIVYWIS